MAMIKNIKIQNFRGIKLDLVFPFEKGNNLTSLAIYGKNGTGKSSIVDAWEWFRDTKISHLAREDAGEKAYPHIDSDGQDSYVELELDGHDNPVRCKYDPKRITQPIITGDHEAFKAIVTHPCHLRYGDLQRFVYFRKAEKYQYLAKYLGFEAGLVVQNGMKTYSNSIQTKIDEFFNIQEQNVNALKSSLEISDDPNETLVLASINRISAKYGLQHINNFLEIAVIFNTLKGRVDDNPKTKELADWKSFKLKLEQFYPVLKIKNSLTSIEEVYNSIKEDEANIEKLSRISLYESGLNILKESKEKNICPLCDLAFEDDLEAHIKKKHIELAELKENYDEFIKQKEALIKILRALISKIERINDIESDIVKEKFRVFFNSIDTIKQGAELGITSLSKTYENNLSLDLSSQKFVAALDRLVDEEEQIKKTVDDDINTLNEDPSRVDLTDDFAKLNELKSSFFQFELNQKKIDWLKESKLKFDAYFSAFNNWIKGQIQAEFDIISNDIVTYFNILEDNHPYIKNPQIKLVEGREKAIELEVDFAGESLSPAYKVLSESQINSFGLAVFLAAIQHFNKEFKFIILDDVINSFDAYKRPRVIELLHQCFSDFQFLVLTHDILWFDQLCKRFPRWNKRRFYGWDFPTGPKIEVAKSSFEKIQDDILKDYGREAGHKLGVYLEWIIQVLNQNLHSPIPFRINNQYVLSELVDALKKRIKDKLKASHKLFNLMNKFETDALFRNYCMHWKDVEYTASEIGTIFTHWKEIESIFQCDGDCRRFVEYETAESSFKCRCGNRDLRSSVYYEDGLKLHQ